MASPDTLFELFPGDESPPATRYATPDEYNDGSTPAQVVQVMDFDPGTTTEFLDFPVVMPQNYDGGGLTIRIGWTAEATSGNVKWDIFLKSWTAGTDNTTTKAFAAANSTTTGTNGTARVQTITTITFTDGADMDSWAAGEEGILRLERDSLDVADTMNSNDAEWHFIEVRET